MLIASNYPLLDIFWTILEIFLFVVWIWLFVVVIGDIFLSHDLGGWGKALWVLAILIFPLIGVLVYLIVRGGSMHERSAKAARSQQKEFDDYVRQTAGASPADEVAKLADLRAKGVITDAEFEAQKAKILS